MAVRFGITPGTRHLQLRYLYVQHLVAASIVQIVKVSGFENPADLFTKYVAVDVLNRFLDLIGVRSTAQYFNMDSEVSSIYSSYIYDINILKCAC